MRKSGPARQPSAKSLGVLPWQRHFWLLMVEHALAEKLGPPELSRLEGFNAPAVTQYTVTTPDLLRSFRKYNAGKPYHRQVRPFGFMVMFQQADDSDPSTVMRVIAPFNRNPLKAARKAFDRDTGAPVRPGQLKTYAEALHTYHNHPESKFLNGERGDRGPTQRRHVIARSFIHIGKETNKLEPQQLTGIDPHAQVEFHADRARRGRLKAIAAATKQLGSYRIARESGISRKHVSAITSGSLATDVTLAKIEKAILSLQAADLAGAAEVKEVLFHLRADCERIGLRQLAVALEIDPGHLSRILARKRPLSRELIRRCRQFSLAGTMYQVV